MDIEFVNDKEALGWGVKMGYAASKLLLFDSLILIGFIQTQQKT